MIIKIKYTVYNFEHIGVPKDSHILINIFFCKKSYFQRLLLHSIALKSNKCQNQHSCCRSNSCIKQSWLFFFPLLSIKDEAQQVRRTSPIREFLLTFGQVFCNHPGKNGSNENISWTRTQYSLSSIWVKSKIIMLTYAQKTLIQRNICQPHKKLLSSQQLKQHFRKKSYFLDMF